MRIDELSTLLYYPSELLRVSKTVGKITAVQWAVMTVKSTSGLGTEQRQTLSYTCD